MEDDSKEAPDGDQKAHDIMKEMKVTVILRTDGGQTHGGIMRDLKSTVLLRTGGNLLPGRGPTGQLTM